MRYLTLLGGLALLALLACGPGSGAEEAMALMAQESDTLSCHTTESVYTNHTGNGRDLHVRLTNDCFPVDTLRMPPAHIRVKNAAGGVVTDITVDWDKTHRGTFTIPAGGSLELECPQGALTTDGCPWTYSY